MRFGLTGLCKYCAILAVAEIDAKELAERVMRGENALRARRAVASDTGCTASG